MKKFKKICALFLSSVFTFSSFAKELVVKVEMESSNLDNTSKTYMSSAYNRFLQDILSVPEISVRTSSVDENLEAILLQRIGNREDVVIRSRHPNRSAVFQLLPTQSNPTTVECAHLLVRKPLVPITFVHTDNFATLNRYSPIGKEIRRVGKNHAELEIKLLKQLE